MSFLQRRKDYNTAVSDPSLRYASSGFQIVITFAAGGWGWPAKPGGIRRVSKALTHQHSHEQSPLLGGREECACWSCIQTVGNREHLSVWDNVSKNTGLEKDRVLMRGISGRGTVLLMGFWGHYSLSLSGSWNL